MSLFVFDKEEKELFTQKLLLIFTIDFLFFSEIPPDLK